MIPFLDQAQQILTQHLEDHTDVGAIGAFVFERVEEADDMFAAGVVWLGVDNLLQQLDLVDSGLCVVCCGADDLERHMFSRGIIA